MPPSHMQANVHAHAHTHTLAHIYIHTCTHAHMHIPIRVAKFYTVRKLLLKSTTHMG